MFVLQRRCQSPLTEPRRLYNKSKEGTKASALCRPYHRPQITLTRERVQQGS